MDKITSFVKKQYMEFPYPHIPVGSLEDEVLYSTNFEFVHYLCTGIFKPQSNIRILDAGCGTGFSTLKLAQQNPDAEITAIDISPRSLEIAKERLEKAGVLSERITFLERDLVNLEDIGRKFDYIVSTGVLHHLSSPEKGLRNLVKHLKDDGIIYLMLYSESGRYSLNLTRKFINLLRDDKHDFTEGMNIGKEFFKVLPDNNSIKTDYKKSYNNALSSLGKEFADSESQFVDAYVNAQERTYNIEELYDFIEKNGLNIIRFYDELIRTPEHMFTNNHLLMEKAKKLSKKDLYKLSEIIYSEQNFAFFAAKNELTKKQYTDEEIYNAKILWSSINKVSENTDNKTLNISNPSGTGLMIQEEAKIVYNLIENHKPVKEIIEEFSKKYYSSEDESRKIIIHFLKTFEQANLLYFRL